MNWVQNFFYRLTGFPVFCQFYFNVTGHTRQQEISQITYLVIVCLALLVLLFSGCTSSVGPLPTNEPKPFISTVQPAQVDPKNAPIIMTVHGSGFRKGLTVRVASSTDSKYSKNLKPVQVRSDELVIRLDRQWLEGLVRIKKPAKPLFTIPFRGAFTVEVNNPDGQKSKLKEVYVQRSVVRIKQVSVRKPLIMTPGSRVEIVVSVDRVAWIGDVPLRVIGFDLRKKRPRFQPGVSQSAKQVTTIVGRTVIPAGASNATLQLDVTSETPPGKYVVILGLFSDIRIARPNEVSIYNPNVPMYDWPIIEVEVMGPTYQCHTCLPIAPKIVEFQRTSEGHIRILFDDRSSNEEGFRIKRVGPEPVWEEIGTVESGAGAAGRLDFIDTTVELGRGYNYKVEAWNDAGVSESDYGYAKPPYHVPSDLRVFFRENDFLLSWMDNSENDPGMDILRREILPGATWEVIRDLSPLSSQGTGPMDHTDPWAERNVRYEYQIRTGDPNPETDRGSAYSEVVGAWFREGLTPAVPSDLWIENHGEHRIRWMDNATNERGYRIYRYVGDGASGFNELVAELGPHGGTGWMEKQFPNYHPDPNMELNYDVIAWNEYGESLIIGGLTIISLEPPEKPGTPVFPDIEARSITVSWEDRSRNEAGFKIERKISGGAWSEVRNFDAHWGTGQIEWENRGLSPTTQYCYRVVAYNDSGSRRSNEACKTTLAAPGPELAFDSFYIVPTTTQSGPNTPFDMYYIACNMGEVATGNFTDRLFFPDRDGQVKTENVSQGSIQAGGCYETRKHFSDGLPEGCYQFGVALDINNDVSEKSEQPGYIWDPSQTPYNPSNEAYGENCWQ
jgi:hypothetical protein